MSLSPIEDIIADLKAGKMVVLVDEEDRENEGDLVMAAEFATPAAVNFMATHGRGLICLTLTDERCKQLGLRQMVADNQTPYSTAFTVSIEAATGVTTGIFRCRPGTHHPGRRRQTRQSHRHHPAGPYFSAARPTRRRADSRRPHRGGLRSGRSGRGWNPPQ